MKKTILAIETSCDDTGIAVVEASGGFSKPKFKVLKNLVGSQVKIHRPFGGVVPGLAKREHIKNLPILLKKLNPKPYSLNPDLIAVTVGPGLEPALWTGITFAKELSREYKKPLIGANHLEGHLYSFLLPKKTESSKLRAPNSRLFFPAVVLLVSGGHTSLLLMKNLKTWKRLGETRDDAAGEAFDKVARMLGLPYPGGPEIEKLSRKGNSDAIDFPRPMLNQKNYDFSFSGIKTSVFYHLRDRQSATGNQKKADIAASFQKAVIETLVKKTGRAAKEYRAKSVILCGGVAANKKLRGELEKAARKVGMNFMAPEMEYNNDNAAMIAAAGYFAYLRGKKLPLKANGTLNI